MTAEWLAWTDPFQMIAFVRDRSSERKLRLFAVGCCCLYWEDIDWKAVHPYLEIAEAVADGEATAAALAEAHARAQSECFFWDRELAVLVTMPGASEAAAEVIASIPSMLGWESEDSEPGRGRFVRLIRHIWEDAWTEHLIVKPMSSEIQALARAVYETVRMSGIPRAAGRWI